MSAPRSHHLEKGGHFGGKDPDSRVHLRLANHRKPTHSVTLSSMTAEETRERIQNNIIGSPGPGVGGRADVRVQLVKERCEW